MGIEHKHNTEALQEQEAHARLVVENAGNLIATLDLKGHFLFCSPSYRTILGYAPEELIGSDAFLLVHPDDLALARQAMTRALAGVADTTTLHVRHKDGHYLTFVGTIKAIPTTQGAPSQFVSIQHDITEQQQTEEERGRLLRLWQPNMRVWKLFYVICPPGCSSRSPPQVPLCYAISRWSRS
jgi:PAS domain S-box-containing protein